MTLQTRAVTSASNFFRRDLCPGSAREEAKYGPDPDTEFSEEGRLLHRYFLTLPIPKELTQPQREVLSLANRYASNFIEEVMSQRGIGEDEEVITDRETELAFRYDGEILMPGHADVIKTFPGRGLRIIVDAKFGVLEVDEAADNDQLAIYAVMTQQRDPVQTTHVAIVQPRNFGPRMSQASYDAKALDFAELEIAKKFYESLGPDAPLIAGEKQCHFCRAKTKCPAYGEKFQALYVPGERAIETIDTPELIRLHQACQFAAKIKPQVSEEMRKRIEAGTLTEYKLGNSGDEREVINPNGLFLALMDNFTAGKFTAERYQKCHELAWGRLEDYVQELTGLSEKKAKELVLEISKPFVKATPKAKKVVKAK